MAVQVAHCNTLGPPLPLSPWVDGMCVCTCAAVEHVAEGISAPSAAGLQVGVGGALHPASGMRLGRVVSAQHQTALRSGQALCWEVGGRRLVQGVQGHPGTLGAPLFLFPGGSWSVKGQESQ